MTLAIVILSLASLVARPLIRRFMRSHGVPEWRADEAYVSRLRRWYRER
jgi:hypothetical protein